MKNNIGIVFIVFLTVVGCGLSEKEMNTAKKHFNDAATKQCECNQLKAKADAKYSECVREYEDIVRYMTMFFDVTKPSESEKKSASSEAEIITAQCKL